MRFFSVITGEIYDVLEDEVDTVDGFSIPIKEEPKRSCPKCFGRLHVGRNLKSEQYEVCPKCIKKCLDVDVFKRRLRKQQDVKVGG